MVRFLHYPYSMSLFAKFMLRRGWIQLSRYGLEMGEDGQLRSATLASPELLTHATPIAPSARAPHSTPLALPLPSLPVQTNVPSLETIDEVPDDDRVWQAAMERAKSQQEGELGTADTDRIARRRVEAEAQADPDTIIDEHVHAETSPTDEEDWEALVAAANARAHQEEDSPNATIELEPEELSDFVAAPTAVCMPPTAGAQVEQDAVPANDDMPADLGSSIQTKSLALPSITLGIQQPVDDSEDWAKLKADAEQKARAEKARKQRAMEEIRRLQTSSRRRTTAPPPRRRLAEGTTNVPHAGLPSSMMAARASGRRAATSDTQPAPTPGEANRAELPSLLRRSS